MGTGKLNLKREVDNMKQYLLSDEENTYTLFVGEAQEVKAAYRSMRKAWINDVSNLCPSHCDFPKFNYSRCYGLFINDTEMTFHVISSDTALRMISDI
jgi:hypothetical protein